MLRNSIDHCLGRCARPEDNVRNAISSSKVVAHWSEIECAMMRQSLSKHQAPNVAGICGADIETRTGEYYKELFSLCRRTE